MIRNSFDYKNTSALVWLAKVDFGDWIKTFVVPFLKWWIRFKNQSKLLNSTFTITDATSTVYLFNESHPGTNLNDQYIGKTKLLRHDQFLMKFTIQSEALAMKPWIVIALDNSQSVRHLILKVQKYHPFKPKLLHEFNEDDFDKPLQLCEQMRQKVNPNHKLLFNICFSDECTFYPNGTVNRYTYYWSDENSHLRFLHNTPKKWISGLGWYKI